ncbi:hypothetical protein CA850_31500 [Micromonospora echinospora]|uniref:hypothetical protein n=1 Tax=Micromonospora echinospora TaxID=1877 RepID=UPI000B5B0631|nr:hypothetical protein CA850_31500 [Micromonospora echinospora]
MDLLGELAEMETLDRTSPRPLLLRVPQMFDTRTSANTIVEQGAVTTGALEAKSGGCSDCLSRSR